jgi:hypothetical protein
MAVGAVLALVAVLALLGARRLSFRVEEASGVASGVVAPSKAVAQAPPTAPAASVARGVALSATPEPAAPPPAPVVPSVSAGKARAFPAPLVVVASRGVVGADALARGETLPIASGAHLSLGFAIDGAWVVDIEGPAAIGVKDAELELEAGIAEVRATVAFGLRTPNARIEASAASFRVSVDATSTRVEGHVGRVVVEALFGPGRALASPPLTMNDAASLVVDGSGVHRAAPVASSRSSLGTAAEARWASALAQLESGDRGGAEAAFRALAADRSVPARLRSRATFRAAQLALGRGDRGVARVALAPLIDDPDASLASDAALLLVTTLDAPGERRAVWDRLLARPLPEPYRSHAEGRRAAE